MGNSDFVERLINVCETSKPSLIQHKLGISHQAAVNYLSGRLPNAEILIRISERTSCSIDWLLTGRGKKLRDDALTPETLPASGQIQTIVGKFLVEVRIDELGKNPVHRKTVKLRSSDVLSEKVLETSNTLAGRDS